MEHLISNTKSIIQNNLIGAVHKQNSLFAWWFNILILVGVLGSFMFFLYSSYDSSPPKENTAIKFEPRTWNNAARNVPTIDYGQIPEVEVTNGISGFAPRTSSTAF